MATPHPPEPASADADGGAAGVSAAKRALVRNVLVYTGARLLLVAVLVAAMLGIAKLVQVDVPLIVALALAIIIQLPVSHVALAGLRRTLTADMEIVGARRRADKAQLRAQLRGEDDPA